MGLYLILYKALSSILTQLHGPECKFWLILPYPNLCI